MVTSTSADVRKKNHDSEAGFIIKKETECKDLGNLQPSKKRVTTHVWAENAQRNLKKSAQKEKKQAPQRHLSELSSTRVPELKEDRLEVPSTERTLMPKATLGFCSLHPRAAFTGHPSQSLSIPRCDPHNEPQQCSYGANSAGTQDDFEVGCDSST